MKVIALLPDIILIRKRSCQVGDSRMIAALHLSVYRCARAARLASRLLRRRHRQPCRPRAVRFPCFRFLRATVCGCCLRLRYVPLPCPFRSCLFDGQRSRPLPAPTVYGSRLLSFVLVLILSQSVGIAAQRSSFYPCALRRPSGALQTWCFIGIPFFSARLQKKERGA